MKQNNAFFMSHAALIAGVYVAVTFAGASVGFGPVQIRFAEALTILPLFTPAAVPGLFVGCLIGNILSGAILPDILFGSLATLIGAAGTRFLRNHPIAATIPPIAANTIIVPFILKYGYCQPFSIPFMMLTVGVGEVISCGVLGYGLMKILNGNSRFIFRTLI